MTLHWKIFEIMLLDDSLKSLILKTHDSNSIKNEALNQNMVTLRQDGVQKVLNGISTIEDHHCLCNFKRILEQCLRPTGDESC